MLKKLQTLFIAFALIAWFSGCATPTDHNAIRLAVSQSNDEAQRLYHVAPFSSDNGKLMMMGNHWVWDGHGSAEGHNLVAKVTFDRGGTPAKVEVHEAH